MAQGGEKAASAVLDAEARQADYAQFGKRDLDKMSWLAPLVNNRLGELLCLQLRHEHLFFFRDEQVVEEIGYGEDGLRFHEREKGKPIKDAEDLKKNGYWLVLPRISAEAAFDAVAATRDGAYYSVFSNQCQDWAKRVRRKALSIQKDRKLALPEVLPAQKSKPLGPTVPAAWYLGLLAIVIGIFGLGAPVAAGLKYLQFVSLLLLGVGISDIIYAVTSKEWDTFFSTVVFALAAILGALVLWLNSYLLLTEANGLLAVVLAVMGLLRVWVALWSRPLVAWMGTLLSGLFLVLTGGVAWLHRDGQAGAWLLGMAISVSFISAGASTIWLNWRMRAS